MKAATGVVGEQPEPSTRPLVAAPSKFSRRLRELLQGRDVRRGVVAILDQGIVSGLAFATSSIIAVASGSYGLGVAHLALLLVIFMMNVQGELVTAPFTVYRRRRQGDQLPVYAGSVFMHHALLTLVGCAVLFCFLLVLEAGIGPTHLAGPLWVVLVAGPCCLLHSFLRHFSFACFRFQAALAMDIVVAVLQLSILVALLYSGRLTVTAMFLVMGGACAVASLGWFLTQPSSFRIVPARIWGHWCENWVFGRWTLCSHVFGCAMTYVLPWLLRAVQDESATGHLAACGKLSALAGTFVLGVAHFLTPKAVAAYSRHGIPALRRVLGVTSMVFLVTVGSFCGVTWILGDWLMVSLFGADFAGTGGIVIILSLSVLLNSLAVVAGNGLWAVDRPQANLIGDVTAMLATLAVALVWIQSLGATGVAYATLVGAGVGAAARGITLWVVVHRMKPEADH